MSVMSQCRQYQDIKTRHKELHIGSDFIKLICSWAEAPTLRHGDLMAQSPKVKMGPEYAMAVCVWKENMPFGRPRR